MNIDSKQMFFETDKGQQKLMELLDAQDIAEASENIMAVIFDKDKREQLFRQFLTYETNVDYDWFTRFFHDQLGPTAAMMKNNKAYFTPPALGHLVAQLNGVKTSSANDYARYDPAAGSGQLTICKWSEDRYTHSPFTYKPSDYFYVAEELKQEGKPSRALPFLLFNFLIRGMDGVVIAGDSVERSISQVYFIQQPDDDMLSFSDVNVMPRTTSVEQVFQVKTWIDKPIEHIEDNVMPSFIPYHVAGQPTPQEKDTMDNLKTMIDFISKLDGNQHEG
jgi:type I restriction-modification system DNA methylase subunit